MRHVFLLILSLLCFCNPFVYAEMTRDSDDSIEIIIIDDNGSTGGSPIIYAPTLIPIQAAYYPSHSTIYVNCLYDLGFITVEIKNETTGAYSQHVVNATQGVHSFLISGTAGHWTITFMLSSQTRYNGAFELN